MIRIVEAKAVDAQALATIEVARVTADAGQAQAQATIEAARIAAEAGQAQALVQADAAINAAQITAQATINAGLIAAGLAAVVAVFIGWRQHKIQMRQSEIQSKLADIETTKINLDLVERRAGFISMVDDLARLIVDIEYRIGDVEEKAVTLVQLADRLEKATLTARHYFDPSAGDVMDQAVTITGQIRLQSDAGNFGDELPLFIRSEVFKQLSADVEKLWEDTNEILFGQTRPFLDRLMRDAESEPANSPAVRNWLQNLIITGGIPTVTITEPAAKSPTAKIAEELA